MGHTLLVEVPEDVYELLRKSAEHAGQSPEALAAQWLATATRSVANDPVEQIIGSITSHVPDWADNHDHYLGQSVMETMHPVVPKGNPDG